MKRLATAALVAWIGAATGSSALAAGNANWQPEVGNPGISRTEAAEASKVLSSTVHEGDLVVGGFFGLAGGDTALHVARWDGATWSPIGNDEGLSGRVNAVHSANGELYAGGTFDERVARYDAASGDWVGLFGFPDEDGFTVNAIASDDTFVYFCGSTDAGVIRYDGVVPLQIGVGAYDLNVATAAAVYRGNVVVGGTEGARLLTWNGGTWSAFDEANPLEPDKQVRALTVIDDILYAAGDAGLDAAPEFNWIAAWDGTTWTAVGDSRFRRGLIGPDAEGLFIDDLTSYGGDLVACGTFTMIDDVPVNHVARWDGTSWRPFGSGVAIKDLKRYPNTVIEVDGSLFVGGSGFEVAGGESAFRIAEWRDDPAVRCIEWAGVDSAWATIDGAIVDSVAFEPTLPNGEATYLPLEIPDRAFDGDEYVTVRGDSLICRIDSGLTGVDGVARIELRRRFRVLGDLPDPVSGSIPFRLTGAVSYAGAASVTGGFYSISVPGSLAFDTHDARGPIDETVSVPFRDLDPASEHVATIQLDVRGVAADLGAAEYVVVLPSTYITAGFGPVASSVAVVEGESVSYDITMLAAPSGPVTVTPMSDTPGLVSVTESVTFTAQNWTTPQTVVVGAVDDAVDRTYDDVVVSHAVTGAPEYAGLSLGDVVVSVADDDTAGVSTTKQVIAVVEGDGGSYMVSLATQPTEVVTVSPQSTDEDLLSIVGNDLVFVPESWFVPQSVHFSTTDDVASGDRSASIVHGIASADEIYAALSLGDVDVTVLDNDVISPLVSFSASNSANGVWLDWQLPSPLDPEAVVTIRYASDAFPETLTDGEAVENGTGGVFGQTTTSFHHVPVFDADTIYYSAFVSSNALDSPRVTEVVRRATVTVDQAGAEARISVSDLDGAESAVLHARLGGEVAFPEMPIAFDRNDEEWFVSLPPILDDDLRGVEFYVEITGTTLGTVHVGSPERPERITTSVVVSSPTQVSERYRMVAMPVVDIDAAAVVASMNAAFGAESAATWKIRRWNGTGYTFYDAASPPAFRPGEAYWVITVDDGAWQADGRTHWPAADGMFDIDLRAGWNMVGNPAGYTLSLDPADVRVVDDGVEQPLAEVGDDVLSGNFHGPIDGTPEATELLSTIAPFGGMWVLNRTTDQRDLTLRLPAVEVAPRPGAGIGYEAGDGTEAVAEIVVASGARRQSVERVVDRASRSSSIAMPPALTTEGLDVSIRAAGTSYAVYVTEDRREAELVVRSPEPAALSGRSIRVGDADPLVVVVEAASGRRWTLDEATTIEVPGGEHVFRLRLESATSPGTPPRSVRAVVRPHPASARSWIDVDVPSSSRVRFSMFDVAGRVVWTAERQLTAGRHSLAWTSVAPHASPAPGVYWLETSVATPLSRRLERVVWVR